MTTARELTSHLAALLRRERHAMADFLVALADFDRRRAWETLGHASLFAFLRRELGLSAGAAQYRKTAAELVVRHPEVEAALREGKLCLSSAIELAKVLTPENVAEVLPRFFGPSSRDAAAVAVSIRPVEHPPVREVVTQVRATAGALEPGPALVLGSATAPAEPEAASGADAVHVDRGQNPVRAPETQSAGTHPATASRPAPATRPEPLDSDRARLHLTVSRRLLAKLEAAKAALSHARPVFGDAWMERCRSAGTHAHAKPAADRTRSPPGSSRVAD